MSSRPFGCCSSCGQTLTATESDNGLCAACDADEDRLRFYEYGNGPAYICESPEDEWIAEIAGSFDGAVVVSDADPGL